mmetsp:Transcript_77547/g.146335  ORF Transcript_77547/g.146335 Transcript_77547/m.146335 type:complete len:682 (-) Transcript_77547:84-2129(-)
MDATSAPSSGIPENKFFGPDGNALKYSTVADDSQQSPKKREAAMLLSTAEKELDSGLEGKDQALMMASNALDILRGIGDIEASADALRIMCQAKGTAGDAEALEALTMAKQELAKFREAGSVAGEGKMLLTISELSVYSERLDKYDNRTLDEAPRAATSARAIFHDLEDVKMEGISCVALGYAHLRRCDKWRWKDGAREREAKAAEDCFLEAIKFFTMISDKANMSKAYLSLASSRFSACYPSGGESFDDWRTTAAQSLDMCRELGNKKEEAYVLYQMSMWYLMMQEHEQALETAKAALEIVREIGAKSGFPESLVQYMATAYLDLTRPMDAQMLCEEELETALKTEDWKMAATMHQMLLHVHNSAERHVEAKEECTKALQLVREKLNDKEWEINLSARMAQVHLCLEEYDEGTKLALTVAESFKKLGDKWQEALTLHTAVHGLFGKEDWESAIRICKRARDVWKLRECKKNEAAVLLLMFQAEIARKNAKEAIQVINQAANLHRKLGNQKEAATALLLSVQPYAMCGKKEKCISAAEKGLLLFQEINDRAGKKWAQDLIKQLKEGPKQDKAAEAPEAGVEAAAPTSAAPAAQTQIKPALDFDAVLNQVLEVAKNAVSEEDMIMEDSPLMDNGMDSLSSVSFRNQLMQRFKGINLPASLIFDHPNIRAITSEIVERSIQGK